jgi:hypothetical protein
VEWGGVGWGGGVELARVSLLLGLDVGPKCTFGKGLHVGAYV